MCYAKTRKEVLAIVEAIASSKGTPVHVSNGWWESFKQRHPQLTLRRVEKLSYARFVASNPVILNHYFDLLEKTLQDNELVDSPSQVFNCDETGLPLLQCNPSSVIGVKGQKHPQALTAETKEYVTVLGCINAAGYAIPPLVIFAGKSINPLLTINEIPGTMYGLNESGWIDSEIFFIWFTRHFLAHALAARPLLLLLDGHSMHYNPEVIRIAAHEGVVFCLPPHTTHLLQPLDKGVIGPLKAYWNEECQKFYSRNSGKVISQYDFMPIFNKAWCKAMTIPNVLSAFRTTGIHPFNRDTIDAAAPLDSGPQSLAEKTGLAFIPFAILGLSKGFSYSNCNKITM